MTGTGVTTLNNVLLEFHKQECMPGVVNLAKNLWLGAHRPGENLLVK